MPIYEYQCAKCGTFEVTQRITEKPLGKCPTCKANKKTSIEITSVRRKLKEIDAVPLLADDTNVPDEITDAP